MTALVTGGSRGIGRAIVRALQADGHKVGVVGTTVRDPNDPRGDVFIPADLTDPGARAFLVASVEAELGPLDILVNNAGEQSSVPALVMGEELFRRQLELMLIAPFDLSKQAAIKMRERGGHIVNILSVSAFQAARNMAGYVAAKHGLLGLTRALALEWAPKIHVNAVAPGLTETDMTREFITPERRKFLESITPSGRYSAPAEIAEAVMFLVHSQNVYGQTIVVDGGWLTKNG